MVARSLDFWNFGFLEIWIFGFFEVWILDFPAIPKIPNSKKSKIPKIQTSPDHLLENIVFLEFWVHREL